MALMDVFTHFSIVRRERRGIRPEEIKELCQELGQCLYEQSQIKKFNNLGEIEETVRDLMIHYVNPEIGIFLSKQAQKKLPVGREK